MSLTAELVVVFLLILLNGFFAMSELAIVSARRIRLKQMAEEGDKGAGLALKMAEDPASFLSIVQIGMTLNSVFAGAFSGATLARHFAVYLNTISWIAPDGEAAALAITVAGVTYFNLVIGELLPKRIGLSYAEPIARKVAFAMGFFATIAAPVVWMLRHSTEISLRLLRLANPKEVVVTEDEVKGLIAESAESGIIKPAERDMLEGVMRMADRTVRTIMTPRLDMVWLDAGDSAEEHKKAIRNSGYSRFPVSRGDLEEIIGVVHAKDILNAAFDGHPLALKTVMRPPLIMPDTTPVLRLLDQFKQSGQHIAVVADEYGSVQGIVSITDILQAITGDLPERGQEAEDKPFQREDGSWLIDGMTPLDEVENLLGLKNMRGEGDFHTLAGFVIEQLRRLPSAGDYFRWEDARFEVVDMDGRRVDKVLVHPPISEQAELDLGR
ncbi:MAG TPA: hemolysin family protein [Alphaproteobacteria bacterium]|nr:hemolysin family protein [Alphaproteobacteria bacterium]